VTAWFGFDVDPAALPQIIVEVGPGAFDYESALFEGTA
jgi:hypothetical protein